MENFISFIIKFNGQFDNFSEYIGGEERLTYISASNISVEALKSNINYILQAESIQGEYIIYYVSTSHTGRQIRSILATDIDLLRLCSTVQQPTVYIVPVGGMTRLLSQSPPFMSQSPPFMSHSPAFSSQFRGDWFSDGPSATSTYHVPDLNDPPIEDPVDEEGYVELDDEEEADMDDETSADDESNDEANDHHPSALWNCTLEDFNAWIRREGGINVFLSSLIPMQPAPTGHSSNSNEGEQLENWLLPVIPLDFSDSPALKDVEALFDDDLALGSIYYSKQDLYIVVGLWHMENRTEFKVTRSSTTRLEYHCRRLDTCPFFLRASARNGAWYVHKLTLEHTCNLDFGRLGARSVRSLAVAAYFAKKMRRDGSIIKPRDIMAELQQKFGIRTSYSVALRARNSAISIIYGGQADSFQMLPTYLAELCRQNPGSTTDLEVGPDGCFKHLFVALGVCRIAFSTYLRPVIVVDATHLKGRNKGVLFVAATKDGNEQTFPLAIGVGPIKNDESWKWFLSRLRSAFGCDEQLLIVSDQHISIANAIKDVYPATAHGLCFYHLQKKLTSYGAVIVKLFRKAAYAYRTATYNKAMAKIQEHSPLAYNRLMCAGPERWARSLCPTRRFSFMTSNAAEVFNSRLLDARRLPICSMVEAFRHILEHWFDMRRNKASARDDVLTEEVVRRISPVIELSEKTQVVTTAPLTYKVHDGNRSWIVHLANGECSCNEFQLDLIPCSHATAAIR